MTENPEYKSYSIHHLEESIRDAMESECTPQEIYDTIVGMVKNNMKYYKACYNDSIRLLALLRGNNNSSIKVHDRDWTQVEDFTVTPGIQVTSSVDGITTEWNDYWNGNVYGKEFNDALERYGYVYTPPTEEERRRFKLDSGFLHNDEDDN
jgi:hypothetical protein